jgi:hypothetical protein
VLFTAGAVPGCLAVAAINAYLYGSPLSSGYAPFDVLYKLSHIAPNLARYPRWLIETQTPLVLLAFAAPFVLRPNNAAAGLTDAPRVVAAVWLCFAGAVVASYLVYLPFDEWWYVRFLLPAYPPLLVLSVAVVGRLVAPLTRTMPRARYALVAGMVAAVAWHGVNLSIDRGAHRQWIAEQRYKTVGEYIASALPEQAVVLSMQHSGGIRFYSHRVTVRYDLIAPSDLDLVIDELERLGYAPYIALDDWEEPLFRDRFAGHSRLADLDWAPVVRLHQNTVAVYQVTSDR